MDADLGAYWRSKARGNAFSIRAVVREGRDEVIERAKAAETESRRSPCRRCRVEQNLRACRDREGSFGLSSRACRVLEAASIQPVRVRPG